MFDNKKPKKLLGDNGVWQMGEWSIVADKCADKKLVWSKSGEEIVWIRDEPMAAQQMDDPFADIM